MQTDESIDAAESHIIHSGLTYFPTHRQILTLVLLAVLEAEGIYICLPLNLNSNMSFLIGQVFLLIVIVYAWHMILNTTPGPMSQLFNEEFIKKTIEQGFKQQHEQDENKICTKCQIETVAKIYHCEQCNRCVYKYFFHSGWLNTCIAKENFAPFVAFLIFLQLYLILLMVDNAIFFFELRSFSEDTIATFVVASFQNAFVSSILTLVSVLILVVVGMLTCSYVLAFRIKGTIQPYNCKIGCDGLRKISSNDKILYKIRQSIRLSNYFNSNQQSSSESSNEDIFRETQDFSANQMNIKSITKLFMLQSLAREKQKSQICSIQDHQGQLFKTDFFQSAKIFRKKQNSLERKKKMNQLNSLNEDISNMTSSKWKKYVRSTFEKDSYVKRNSQLDQVQQRKTQQNQTPAQLFREISNESQGKRKESIMKSNSLIKNKILSKNSDNIQEKENPDTLNLKKIRFVKRGARKSKLTDIFQKESRLEDA